MHDQVADFIQQAETAVAANAAVDPGEAAAELAMQPRVPFQTALRLTRQQEDKMIEHAFTREKALVAEAGRDTSTQPQWWANNNASFASPFLAVQGLMPTETWMGKRCRFEATFKNDVSWRPFTMGPDNIFISSNFTVPLARRICRQMVARAKNNFFGSDPWFSISPWPVVERDEVDDADRVEKCQNFSRYKLHETGVKEDLGTAIQRALVLGECAVKTAYVMRDQMFNVEARVLHSTETGEPVRSEVDGGFFTEQELANTIDAQDGLGTRVFARDQVTPVPMAPNFMEVPLNRRQVLFEGAKSEPIPWKDFLCPLTAKDVQTADCVIHFYDKPVMEFVDLIVKRGMIGDDPDARLGAAAKMVALVKTLSENTNQPKAAANNDSNPGEGYVTSGLPGGSAGLGPVSEFAEFWMWYDANGDGVAENICLICDKVTRAPIFYDHVANTTVDGLRPIDIVRVNPVDNRWYGLGIMELFESYQTITDLLVNRWNFSQSRSGRVDLWTPTNTLEGDREPGLKMNWGGTYTKKAGMKKEDVLETVYLTDVKFEQIHQMIQFFMQLAMNESGVTNANDDQAAGMQSAKLATGIIEVAESGDELFKPMIADLAAPLEKIVERNIGVTLANLNPEEVFTYFEGETAQIETMTPADVHGLRFKAKIELTTMKNNQQLQMSAQAAALVEKFYMLLPEVQMRVVSFYRQQLRILAPQADVNTVLIPLVPMMGVPGQPGTGTMPGGAPGQPGTDERGPVGGAPAGPPKAPGGAKLGDAGAGGSTPFPTQLTQAPNKKVA
jgi:hypothetical protein